jgi:CRP/FNR family cyclic AMP-dependent transcriptional regulator
MSIDEDLRNSILADNLSDEEVKLLSDIASSRTFYKNESIFDEEQDGDSLFILVEGRVRIEGRALQNHLRLPKQIFTVKHGQVFGEMAFIEKRNRSASARAKGNVRVIAIPSEPFVKLIKEKPILGLKVMTNLALILSKRLRRMNDQWLGAIGDHFPLPEFEYI